MKSGMNNFKKLIIISFKGFKCRKRLNFQIIFLLACISFLLCLYVIFSISLLLTLDNMKTMTVSANYILSNEKINVGLPDDTQETIVKHYNLSTRVEEATGIGGHKNLIYYSVAIELDDELYICDNRFPRFDVYFDGNVFTPNDYTELERRFGLKSFISGELPQRENEILISEYLLLQYNLTPEEVIGKKITFKHRFSNANLFEQLIITGVIIKEFNQLTGHTDPFLFQFVPSILISQSSDLFKEIENVEDEYIYSFTEWLNSNDANYILNLFDCKYTGKIQINSIEFINNLRTVASNLFLIFGISLGVGLLLIIYLTIDKYVKFGSRSGGILQLCGMDRKALELNIYLQILLLFISATLLSVILTSLGYILIKSVLVEIFYIRLISVGIKLFSIVFLVGLLIVFVIVNLFYLFVRFGLGKKTIKEMLNTKIG